MPSPVQESFLKPLMHNSGVFQKFTPVLFSHSRTTTFWLELLFIQPGLMVSVTL
jgi:hypothetical protein